MVFLHPKLHILVVLVGFHQRLHPTIAAAMGCWRYRGIPELRVLEKKHENHKNLSSASVSKQKFFIINAGNTLRTVPGFLHSLEKSGTGLRNKRPPFFSPPLRDGEVKGEDPAPGSPCYQYQTKWRPLLPEFWDHTGIPNPYGAFPVFLGVGWVDGGRLSILHHASVFCTRL